MNKTLPSSKGNPTANFVSWFFRDFMNVKPDGITFARWVRKPKDNSPCLRMLFEAERGVDSEIYTPQDMAMLLYELEENGIRVSSPGVLLIPGLAMSYMNRRSSDRAREEYSRILEYLRRNSQSDNSISFNAPSGW